MIKNIIKKFSKSKIEILLTMSFAICLSSINTVQDDFVKFFYFEKKNFFNYLNFFRFIAPTFIIVLLSFFFTFNKNINKLLLYFFFYAIWQILIFTIQSPSPLNYIVNYQLILNSISILLIFLLADQYNVELEKKILFILIVYISLISIFFYSKLIFEFIDNKNLLYLYGTDTLFPESKNFEQANPRVTGLARMFLLIFFFLFFYHLNISNKFVKIIFFLISFFLIMGIYATQTRGGAVGILIFVIFYLFFFKEKLIKKILYILCLILIPMVTFEGIIYLKKDFHTTSNKSSLSDTTLNTNTTSNKSSLSDTTLNTNNVIDSRIAKNISSSGRIDIWKASFKIIKEKKIILGKGPQADRLLLSEHQGKSILNNNVPIFDNNSSNALIYSFLSGGLISFVTLLIVYFLILRQIFFYLFIKKAISKKYFLINFSLITLIFLTVRTVFENGYAVFGVDYLFCITCYFILIKSYKIKNNYYLFLMKFKIFFFSFKKYFSLT
jgi:hypothetical protein